MTRLIDYDNSFPIALKAEDKIREGIEPLSKAANLFVKLKRYIEFILFSC